jgi:ketosteroid isomerase-like protein
MTNEEVVRRYFWCMDNEEWEQMAPLWHPDAVMRATGARLREGRAHVIELLSKLFEPWPEHRDEPTRLIHAGDTVVVEVTFTGRTRDGRAVSFDAVDVFDLRDGQIVRMSNWYDTAYARRQLAGTT